MYKTQTDTETSNSRFVQHNAQKSENVEMNVDDANETGVTNPNRTNQ